MKVSKVDTVNKSVTLSNFEEGETFTFESPAQVNSYIEECAAHAETKKKLLALEKRLMEAETAMNWTYIDRPYARGFLWASAKDYQKKYGVKEA